MSDYSCAMCGFLFCDVYLSIYGCQGCKDQHADAHDLWLISGLPPSSAPRHAANQPPTGTQKKVYIKYCPSCEERYNVSDHICKKKDISKDWLDVMRKLP